MPVAMRTMRNKRARRAACTLVALSERKCPGKPVRGELCEDVRKYRHLALLKSHSYWGKEQGVAIFIGTNNQAYSVRKMNFNCEIFITTSSAASWIGFLLISGMW